jgi:hypothetical protein
MQRTRGRHAAITKNLYTWSSYKHWADKVKGSWEKSRFPAPARSKREKEHRVSTRVAGNSMAGEMKRFQIGGKLRFLRGQAGINGFACA